MRDFGRLENDFWDAKKKIKKKKIKKKKKKKNKGKEMWCQH